MTLLSCWLPSSSSSTCSDDIPFYSKPAMSLSIPLSKSRPQILDILFLDEIPTELIIQILKKLDFRSFNNCWTTTKWLCRIMEDNSLALKIPVPWQSLKIKQTSFQTHPMSALTFSLLDQNIRNVRYNGSVTLHCESMLFPEQVATINFLNRITYNEIMFYQPIKPIAISILCEINPRNIKFFYQKTLDFPYKLATLPSIINAKSVVFNFYGKFNPANRTRIQQMLTDIQTFYSLFEYEVNKMRVVNIKIHCVDNNFQNALTFETFFENFAFQVLYSSLHHDSSWLAEETKKSLKMKWSHANGFGRSMLYCINLQKSGFLAIGLIMLSGKDLASLTLKTFGSLEEMKKAFHIFGARLCHQ